MISTVPFRKRVLFRDNSLIAWVLAHYFVSRNHKGKHRLSRWLYRIAKRPPVIVRYADRAKLSIHLDDLVQFLVLRDGFYEPEVWAALQGYSVGGDIVWDVGGHVGTFAVLAALDQRVKRVYCFEPNPSTVRLLKRNLSLNSAMPIQHVEKALGVAAGHREMYSNDPQNIGLATLVPGQGPPHAKVECVSVDELLRKGGVEPPTLMKIDVEGLERDVLIGARELLRNGTLRAIVFEAEVDDSLKIKDVPLMELLLECGYEIRMLPRPEGFTTSRENFVAYRSH